MRRFLARMRRRLFVRLDDGMAADFARYCAHKNNARFSVLPFFNIITQVACFFIYLYIYPATFPEKPRLDYTGFALFSLVYMATNIAFFVLFNRQRRTGDRVISSRWILLVFLVGYVAFESLETIIEVEISGNIYRFLATFFMVAFLPVMRRREKLALLALFTALVEIGFAYLAGRGYASNNRFEEIVLLFFIVCLVVAHLSYNSTIRTFSLQQSLIAVNDELRRANEQLEHLAVIDPLTEIANRRAFTQFVTLAWRAAYRDGRALGALMVDIDDFKSYNDTYGHQKGDDCLRAVAATIAGCFQRGTDMVARYGGEEFIVLTAQDDGLGQDGGLEKARARGEKICESVRALGIGHANGGTGGVTVSVGVAVMTPAGGARYEDLIKRADDALYAAKKAGKNRVRAAD